MKKFVKMLSLGLFIGTSAVFLASCGDAANSSSAEQTSQVNEGTSNVSKSYAAKIRVAANNKKYVTYEQAKAALGAECVDEVNPDTKSGTLTAVKGYTAAQYDKFVADSNNCKNQAEKDEFMKGIEIITITVFSGQCVSARYIDYDLIQAQQNNSKSKATKSYAELIVKAAENGEYVTYEDAKNALGTECVDEVNPNTKSGTLTAIKGYTAEQYNKFVSDSENCKSQAEMDEFMRGVEIITITVQGGNCIWAEFIDYDIIIEN